MRNYTKRHILNSFNHLMTKFSFDKITINMIINKSEISKSTFYRYYIDKYEVMNYSYVIFVEKMFEIDHCNCIRDLFVGLLENASVNSTRLKHAYAYIGMNSFTTFLHDYSCQKFNAIIEDTRKSKITETEKLRMSLCCYGCIWIIKDYIDNKIDLPIHTIADNLCKSLPPSIQNMWD